MADVSRKKVSIAKTVALNYISPKVYRITHHAQIFTVTATTNVTWENCYLESMDLFQITVYQISKITGSKSLQKQNRIK